MKKSIFSVGSFAFFVAISVTSTTVAQVNSATMYKGSSSTPGSSGSYYGTNCDATGTHSLAGGYAADATGAYSIAMGVRNLSTNFHATTIGVDLQANANRSFVFGSGVVNNPGMGTDLINGISHSLMIGFNSDIPTLFVGGASGLGTIGKVGIGTTSPASTFHVADMNGSGLDAKLEGFTLLDGANASLLLGNNSGSPYGDWGIEALSTGLNFWNPFGGTTPFGNYRLFIANNGNVSIGTDDSKGYKLAVAGDMVAEKVVVKLQANWPDFVFTDTYGLMELNDVESYIDENCHLPNVPSAQEIEESGIDLGEMNRILLQKIEELTLYTIDQDKKINQLIEEVETLKNEQDEK